MKLRIITTLTLLVLLALPVMADNIPWVDRIDTALEKAKKEKKPVFLLFTGSDWCIWCKRLEGEVISKEAFQNWAPKHMVMAKLDLTMRTELPEERQKYISEKMKEYGARGFPTVLILDSAGEVVGKTGYQKGGPEAYIKHLQELVKKE